jgi:hypothetical protein
MIDFTHYIKAKSVADTYLQHSRDLNGTPKKQHFMARLSLCNGYKGLLDDNRTKTSLFKWTSEDLAKKLGMSWDEIWDEMPDEFGYNKEIKQLDDEDIKFYVGMTDVMEKVCILMRNGIPLPEGVEKKVNRRYLLKMMEIADRDTVMHEIQGTTFINGIGQIIYLKNLRNDLVPINWSTINDCYRRVWRFYIEKVGREQKWMLSKNKRHNYIYGLTHGVINITNYYDKPIVNDETWVNEIKETCNVLINLVDSQRLTNYSLFTDDALAEMLMCIKLCGQVDCIERIAALNALSLRFDSTKLIFREHKCEKFKDELLQNEHTNILYILNVLF